MPVDIPKYLRRAFKTQPADAEGVAKIDDVSAPIKDVPMLLFKAANDPLGSPSHAVKIAIRINEITSDEEISQDPRTADLTIGAFKVSYEDIVKFGSRKFVRDGKMFDKKEVIGGVVRCTAAFDAGRDCIPPFDYSPPCKNPQPYFDLVGEDDQPTGLDGAWFVLVGSIRSKGAQLPEGATIHGEIALLFKTE